MSGLFLLCLAFVIVRHFSHAALFYLAFKFLIGKQSDASKQYFQGLMMPTASDV
jgi:hypothetical protein